MTGQHYYTIGQVAKMFDVNVSLIRFWSDTFSEYVRPDRNNKGNRLYREADIAALKNISRLVKDQGMTLEGARKRLRLGVDEVDRRSEAIERLRNIRATLVEVNKSL
ncbi:MAG TPA: MerR family transcriptional regulator [Bacteroidales bacterium]|jgi:DNA-binding transcriptional MerR regulator|nr:MerR family transcriptional regulator [Bacteroidales bacterium]HKM12030.1 MerR family transcriptional regulator [Bacteroidales bacterium]HPB89767.1 MerR family transcriptional regulator [Bacteroidales bacterium]HPY22007.1 MerR family transcriptional regulator [Bacteroidales bacterium]HQA92992.1 MerR family transcriptional regulator [Bacteroidales bacterium]